MATIINGRGRVGVRTSVGPGGGYGTLTTAWIAATGETDATIIGALNTLETTGNSQGWLSKMKALYPFVGGTAVKHKFNFMNAQDTDAAFRLVFSGGWTHSSTGVLPNGTNGYADTKFSPFNVFSTNDSGHISLYSRTNQSKAAFDFGTYDGRGRVFGMALSRSDLGNATTYFINNINTPASYSPDNNTSAFYLGTRTNSSSTNGFRNSTKVATSNETSTLLPLADILLGNINFGSGPIGGFYTSKEYAFASIGDGLTDTEAANFYTAVQAFQTTLGRQV